MLLNQLVRINEAGIVADAVDFRLMERPETNQKLCEGFVFNYDKDKQAESTVGVLEALRSSYDSRNAANVHLLVQQYGKGKSHFAVAIANYFSKPTDSPEVQGILTAVENAAGRNSAIVERLRSYKKYGRHLVVCLMGDRQGDIRKQFLQSLLKTLEAEGIKDSVAQHICRKPLKYLQKISEDSTGRERAEAYLENIRSSDGDLNSIIQQLQKNNPAVITTAKNLVAYIKDVDAEDIDFTPNIDIEEILKDLITTHCSGENPRFQGILILFDELNYYLLNYAKDPIGSGGTALQNITSVCELHKSKIALLSFTQIDPYHGVGISVGALEAHIKLVSRLAPKGSTYQKVASSLELVLKNLLIQDKDKPEWESFRTTWDSTLLAETQNAYEKRITSYREKGWTRNDFHKILTLGCFPLHPLTAYLLCNLSFTQDRTAIQFLKKHVKDFIQNEALEKQSKLNWVNPISLIDFFPEDFADDSNYSPYRKAEVAVTNTKSDDPNELPVLKALFLFHASGKIAKTPQESHEEVLATLTGLSTAEVKAALNKLENTRNIIHYKPQLKLYVFWTGIDPRELQEEIERRVKEKNEVVSIERVIAFCQANIEKFLGSKTLQAKYFVDTNKLVLDDWQFEYKLYTVDSFSRALTSDQTLRHTQERGILACVLAETQAEVQDFRRRVDSLLERSPIRNRVAVSIPSNETGDLAYILLKIQTLKNSDSGEKRIWGAAYETLLQRWTEQVDTQASNLLKSCTYHCFGVEKIPPAEREKPQRVISALLENLYSFVPPIDGIDKLRSGHMTGRKVVGSVSRQLLAENLTDPLPDNTYSLVDTLFVSRWKLLKKTSRKYTAREPENERVKAAWDLISKIADLGEQAEQTIDLKKIWTVLSEPPYGYNEYTFTMLLAGWLSYHRKEVALKGNATIPEAGKKGPAFVPIATKSLKDWAVTNILEKPDEFVKKWIITGNAKLIRRKKVLLPVQPQSSISYTEAEQYLLEVQAYLEAGDPDPIEIEAVTKVKDQVAKGVTQINEWFQPVETAEALPDNVPLDLLLEVYPKLLLSPPSFGSRDDVISVKPIERQSDRYAQALQAVSGKIERQVDNLSECSETLDSVEACGAYKEKIQRLLTQISQVSSLPPHWAEALQSSLTCANRRLIELKESAKVRDCLSQIESRYKSLGNSPAQQDYRVTLEAIEALAQATPAVKQEEAYEQILLNLNQAYDTLTRQVEIWEEKSIGLVSPEQIHALKGEINGRHYRFSEESSTQKITKLLEYLDRELSRGRNKDEAVKAIKDTLSTANSKLERIRNVAASRLPEAFQSYQELIDTSLPITDSAIEIEEYQEELEGFKAKGRSALITEGFANVYSLELKRLEDHTRLKTLLQQRLDFIIAHEDFTDVRVNLEQALKKLEVRYKELQKQQQEQQRKADDDEIIRFVRAKYKLPKTNTIQFLEDGILEIQSYQSRLYEAESFASEIEQIIHALQDKITNHSKGLNDLSDRLSQTNTLRELERIQTDHARLEFVFKDSSQYTAYQSLQQQFQELKEDLERLKVLEDRSQQSTSIASCHEVLTAVHGERARLYHPDRFQDHLNKLANSLQHKIETYIQALDDFDHRSKHLSTAKEAQKLHEELLKQSVCYAQSELSDRYEAISTNIRHLIELFQISQVEIKTLETCRSQLEKLTQWKENEDVLDPSLQERFDSIRAVTEQTEARLLQRQQNDAERWIRSLENQAAELQSLADEAEKSRLANKLLNKIQREQSQHTEKLNAAYQKSLKDIECQCEAEITKDRENQIKNLFQQLPRAQRISLYRQLEAYLADPTEEFNG